MKKIYLALIIAVFSVVCFGASAFAADYPTKNITCVIQWGAGGGTDNIMRPLCSLAEQELGQSLVMQNMTGGTGSIATQFVHDKAADGYTLLIGAENPALYDVLNISKLTYEDFVPVFLVGDEAVGIIVKSDSKYKSFKELIEDAKANPGKIKYANCGRGSMPWLLDAYISSVTGAKFAQIPYDSDAAARTAVMNGECVFTACKIQTGLETHKAGQVKFLTVMTKEPVPSLPDVPVIVDEFPEFADHMPWSGAFYGVFAKKGTDPKAVAILGESFKKAFANQTYLDLLESYMITPMGSTGDEAAAYISQWRARALEIINNAK